MTIQVQLSTFNFNNSLVRTTDINGQVWFLANDVCDILGYKNPRRTIALHCKEKGVTKRYTPTSSGEQEMIYISEPNLFRLTVKSKKDEAIQFEEWVFEDLLPTIRKTGKYELPKKTTVDQRTPLRDAVNLLVSKKAITYSEAYSIVHQRFNVASIEDLPQDQLSHAVEYVHKVALEGEYIPKEISTSRQVAVNKTNLSCLINSMEWIYKYYKEYNLLEVSRMLQSDFGTKLHDHIISGYTSSRSLS